MEHDHRDGADVQNVTLSLPGGAKHDQASAADPVLERRYPQPDPEAFAQALAEVDRELVDRRLSADGAPDGEVAARRSTAWAHALRRRGWPATAVPRGPEPWADPDFLDEDGEPIDYSDVLELPAEAWAQARPNCRGRQS